MTPGIKQEETTNPKTPDFPEGNRPGPPSPPERQLPEAGVQVGGEPPPPAAGKPSSR